MRTHSLSFFIEPVLLHHDHERVEIYCYFTHPVADTTTQRLKNFFDHWRDCADMDDAEMTRMIRTDQIDVLVDLSGHTSFNRLGVFARRAAPVQVTWLGYQASTGLSTMDYRITDKAQDPIGVAEKYHTERLIRLSTGAVFQPAVNSPDVSKSPCLKTGIFTFGCMNHPAKLTDTFLESAVRILAGTTQTRLLLGHVDKFGQNKMLERLIQHGASPDRVVMIEKVGFQEYLELHAQIDLSLDTFPYNGGTTTMHSLWMGVPILALEGKSSISRVGSELMKGLNLPEFSCSNLESYIETAIDLSRNSEKMSFVRGILRKRMSFILVEQAKAFTRELEAKFREISQS